MRLFPVSPSGAAAEFYGEKSLKLDFSPAPFGSRLAASPDPLPGPLLPTLSSSLRSPFELNIARGLPVALCVELRGDRCLAETEGRGKLRRPRRKRRKPFRPLLYQTKGLRALLIITVL